MKKLAPFTWNHGMGRAAFTFDRIGRGTVRVESNTLWLPSGGIQPDLLARAIFARQCVVALARMGCCKGFNSRVWPDVSKEWRNIDRLAGY